MSEATVPTIVNSAPQEYGMTSLPCVAKDDFAFFLAHFKVKAKMSGLLSGLACFLFALLTTGG
jgi:hypothetical protein